MFNLVPRGRDPFGQRRGFQRMTKGTPGDEVVDSVKLFVTPDISSNVWSDNFCIWSLDCYVMWNDNDRRRDRVGWGGVSKRVWVTALLFPSLAQRSVLRRYHHLEHLITPFSWTLLSGAKRHPQINGFKQILSPQLLLLSYLKIVNKIQWAVLIISSWCTDPSQALLWTAHDKGQKKLSMCENSDSFVLQGEHVEKRKYGLNNW